MMHKILYPLRAIRKLGLRGVIGYLYRRVFRGEDFAYVRIAGLRIAVRPNTPDRWVARESLGDEFEPLMRFCDPRFSGLIVDAGGYIGTAALALHRIFPNARIVSIEPSADNFRLLLRNTLPVKEIFPIRAALGANGSGRLAIADRGTGPWGYTVVENPNDVPDAQVVEEVPRITLDQVAKMFGTEIGVLKLDIEGGEHDLLMAAASDLRRIPVIFIELHERIVPGCTALFREFSEGRHVENFGGEKYICVDRSRQALPA